MPLIVTQRPSKEIEGYLSRWNAINLPIQYKFESDLFPTNTVDATYTVTGWSNNLSYLEITLNTAVSNIEELESIRLTDDTIPEYNGIFKVKKKISSTKLLLKLAYKGDGGDSTVQKYYANYFVEVRLYSGLSQYHPKGSEKPYKEVGVLREIPNTSNEIVASFSSVIKSDVKMTNNVSDGIDLDYFTGFYVEFREGYDSNVNGKIETNYGLWTNDNYDNCGNELIYDGFFDTGLDEWGQDPLGGIYTREWVAIGGEAVVSTLNRSSNSSIQTGSKLLYQYNMGGLVSGITYNLYFNVDRVGSQYGDSTVVRVFGYNTLSQPIPIWTSGNDSGNVNYDIYITVDRDFEGIGFLVENRLLYGDVTNKLGDVSLRAVGCEMSTYASHSSLQFQNIRGGNMYDYILGRPDSKFMSDFNAPTLFRNYPFSLSAIIDSDTESNNELSDLLTFWFNGEDLGSNGDYISDWGSRVNTGDFYLSGVGSQRPVVKNNAMNGNKGAEYYKSLGNRLLINSVSDLPQTTTIYICLRIDTPVSGGIIGTCSTGASIHYDGSYLNLRAGTSSYTPLSVGEDHVLKIKLDNGVATIYDNNEFIKSENVGTEWFKFLSETYYLGFLDCGSIGAFNGVICEVIAAPNSLSNCDFWKIETYLGNKYDTYDTSSLGYTIQEFSSSGELLEVRNGGVINEGAGVYRLPIEKLNSEASSLTYQIQSTSECQMSEIKTININKECYNNEMFIKWINTKGGIESWLFTGAKDYILTVDDKTIVERNVFNNWDSDFINGDTELDVINTRAYKEIEVYSQLITKQELEAISGLKYSSKVFWEKKDGSKITIIVDKESFVLFNDDDENDLVQIKFRARLGNIQIQSQ